MELHLIEQSYSPIMSLHFFFPFSVTLQKLGVLFEFRRFSSIAKRLIIFPVFREKLLFISYSDTVIIDLC